MPFPQTTLNKLITKIAQYDFIANARDLVKNKITLQSANPLFLSLLPQKVILTKLKQDPKDIFMTMVFSRNPIKLDDGECILKIFGFYGRVTNWPRVRRKS